MKTIFLAFMLQITPLVWAGNSPELKEIGVSDVYIPVGFDDNDNVEVVIEGIFNNTGYKKGPITIETDEMNKKIRLRPHAYVSKAGFQVIVPFEYVVPLGVLKSGEYSLEIGNAKKSTSKLIVDPLDEKKRKLGPDNFLYAPIKSIEKLSDAPLVLRLKGAFTNSCMSIDHVEVRPSQNQVLAILPIAKYEKWKVCTLAINPFSVDVSVEEKLKGRYLFHVRSLNGASVNLIEDVF